MHITRIVQAMYERAIHELSIDGSAWNNEKRVEILDGTVSVVGKLKGYYDDVNKHFLWKTVSP